MGQCNNFLFKTVKSINARKKVTGICNSEGGKIEDQIPVRDELVGFLERLMAADQEQSMNEELPQAASTRRLI